MGGRYFIAKKADMAEITVQIKISCQEPTDNSSFDIKRC
jgi:hypothetical protein